MIPSLLKLVIICTMLYMIRKVYDMLQPNLHAHVLTIDKADKDRVYLELKEKSPMFMRQVAQSFVSLESLNTTLPGYMIDDKGTLLSLDLLTKSPDIHVFKNSKMVQDFALDDKGLQDLFMTPMSCGIDTSLSLTKGEHTSSLLKNYRETCVIQPLAGELTLYLFNPKHEKDIKGLHLKNTKKWGIKLVITQDSILYIPPEWFYFYESKDLSLVGTIECDEYLTYLYNLLR